MNFDEDEMSLHTLFQQTNAVLENPLRQSFENRMQSYTNTGAPFDVEANGDIARVGCEGCQRTADETLGGAGGRNL